ncbi:MAG: cytochrome b N-terminal domain-containing protein [Acidobacteriota bacterium]|nr:cytochrome b N-terminal domain-containing protein [Acidobacteriota bacterium]
MKRFLARLGLGDWLDARTGYRDAASVMLDEPLPPGTGWFFTLGSVLLALLSIQLLTGAFLTLYYAPTPDHAYDSVRFITSFTAGRLVRGLHHYGASFIVVAMVAHMLRVILFGSYKPPREVTWLSGLALFGLVLAFSLTGYLLPWDQRAYWATVVTINIAKLTPMGGDIVAGIMQGGATIGALTLTRWYSAHVIFLPAGLIALVALHMVLMRKQGISGPVTPRAGHPVPFYPAQASRDVTMILLILAALVAFAWRGMPPLEGPADPTDATFIPRPEWYFLGLFQLLKYFPGKWEVVGAMVIPGLAAGFLALLPWIDRGPERDPRRRRGIMAAVAVGLAAVAVLTTLGWRDSPVTAASRDAWTLREIGGRPMVLKANCARCHSETGVSEPLEGLAATRGPEWLEAHVLDPEMIAPGLREPPVTVNEREAAAMAAYARRAAREPYPGFSPHLEVVAPVFARYCIGCHRIDGDGGDDGPDLSRAGAEHDAPTLRRWIEDPELVDPDAEMPSFGDRLTAAQLDTLSEYLASRK